MKNRFFKINTKLPKQVKTLPVYRSFEFDTVSRKDKGFIKYSDQKIKFLRNFFGIKGKVTDLGDEYMIRNEKEALEVFLASDSFWWTNRKTAYSEDIKLARKIPDKDVAIKKANSIIESLNLNSNLLKFKSIGYNYLSVSKSPKKRDKQEVPTNILVNYGFEINKIPIFGPGAKVQVSFTSKNSLAEFLFFFRNLQDEKKLTKIISPEEALGLIEGNYRFKKIKKNKKCSGIINSIALGYYSESPSEFQRYLIPVYKIKGSVLTPDLPKYDFNLFVLATRMTKEKAKKLGVISEPLISNVFN